MVYIKEKRKFNDAWAFILYVLLYLSSNKYLLLQYTKHKIQKQENIDYYLVFARLGVTLFFIFLNFFGFTFFAEIYIKTTILSFPFLLLVIYYFFSYSDSTQVTLAISIGLWSLFLYFYWKRISAVANILKHSVKIINANYLSCMFGIILCTGFQAIQFFLLSCIDIGKSDSEFFILILVVLNTLWSILNMLHFFRAYISSLVAYHFIDFENGSTSVFGNSIINTTYALGSISFASFLLALVKILKLVYVLMKTFLFAVNILKKIDYRIRNTCRRQNTDRGHYHDRRRNSNENFLLECIFCMISLFLSILDDIIRFANMFTMPYIVIHGDNYINSVKESWKLLGDDNKFAVVGLKAIDYSLGFSFFAFIFCFFSISSYLPGYSSTQDIISTEMFIKLISLNLVLFIFYLTTMMIFSSSFLALNYLYIENPEVINSVDPSISESFEECKKLSE